MLSHLDYCLNISLVSEGLYEVKVLALVLESQGGSLNMHVLVSSVYPRVRPYRHTEMHAEALHEQRCFCPVHLLRATGRAEGRHPTGDNTEGLMSIVPQQLFNVSTTTG